MTKWKRPEVLEGYTLKLPSPCGSFFLTLNEHEDKLREVRMTIGKSGNCQRLLFETIGILVSVLLQEDIPKEKVAKALVNQLEGCCGNRIYDKGAEYTSCIDFMVQKIIEDMGSREEIETA